MHRSDFRRPRPLPAGLFKGAGLPPDVPGFAYNNPAKYPNLDEPDHHYDGWHLNEKGAAEPTSLLARPFAEQPRRAP